jgi:hypothetical protein
MSCCAVGHSSGRCHLRNEDGWKEGDSHRQDHGAFEADDLQGVGGHVVSDCFLLSCHPLAPEEQACSENNERDANGSLMQTIWVDQRVRKAFAPHHNAIEEEKDKQEEQGGRRHQDSKQSQYRPKLLPPSRVLHNNALSPSDTLIITISV